MIPVFEAEQVIETLFNDKKQGMGVQFSVGRS